MTVPLMILILLAAGLLFAALSLLGNGGGGEGATWGLLCIAACLACWGAAGGVAILYVLFFK